MRCPSPFAPGPPNRSTWPAPHPCGGRRSRSCSWPSRCGGNYPFRVTASLSSPRSPRCCPICSRAASTWSTRFRFSSPWRAAWRWSSIGSRSRGRLAGNSRSSLPSPPPTSLSSPSSRSRAGALRTSRRGTPGCRPTSRRTNWIFAPASRVPSASCASSCHPTSRCSDRTSSWRRKPVAPCHAQPGWGPSRPPPSMMRPPRAG
jgi:hypothetical protein